MRPRCESASALTGAMSISARSAVARPRTAAACGLDPGTTAKAVTNTRNGFDGVLTSLPPVPGERHARHHAEGEEPDARAGERRPHALVREEQVEPEVRARHAAHGEDQLVP